MQRTSAHLRPTSVQGDTVGDMTSSTVGPSVVGSLAEPQVSAMLRLVLTGSVDDGKSTLIGRLLYDSKQILTDQLEALRAASARRNGENGLDLSLLTDGLRAEREQGITIDVAYRYFQTARRKFIIADTPGHERYTRNMVTGASTADLAVILIDVRQGVVEQTRRHAFIASLLGIRHLVVCVNKMDLVGYEQAPFDRVEHEFREFCARLETTDVTFIPVSAVQGENVVERSERMDWYQGPALLYHLEHVHIASDRNLIDCRLPVQWVTRTGPNSRSAPAQARPRPRPHRRSLRSGRARGPWKKAPPPPLAPRVPRVPRSSRCRVFRPAIPSSSARRATRRGSRRSRPRWTLGEACALMLVVLRLVDDLGISRGNMIR